MFLLFHDRIRVCLCVDSIFSFTFSCLSFWTFSALSYKWHIWSFQRENNKKKIKIAWYFHTKLEWKQAISTMKHSSCWWTIHAKISETTLRIVFHVIHSNCITCAQNFVYFLLEPSKYPIESTSVWVWSMVLVHPVDKSSNCVYERRIKCLSHFHQQNERNHKKLKLEKGQKKRLWR